MTFDRPQALRQLNDILSKARMSPRLRDAVEAIRAALNTNNLYLATELSAVKGYIVSEMNMSPITGSELQARFREDGKHNEHVLGGRQVYDMLGSLHFDLAMALHQMPSGFMEIRGVEKTGQGRFDYGLQIKTRHSIPASASSILADMQAESDDIKRHISGRYS